MCSSTSLSVRCSTNRDAFAFCLFAETQHGTALCDRVLLGLQSRASFVWTVAEVNEKCSERLAFLLYDRLGLDERTCVVSPDTGRA